MKVVFSGEGTTDLGGCRNQHGTCSGEDFKVGPIAALVSQLMEEKLNYSILDYPDNLHFISKSALCEAAKKTEARLKAARGKKKGVEMGYYFENSMMLGRLAKEIEVKEESTVLAVFFRDADGTRSHPGNWTDKWQSMLDGFSRSGFDFGVPMLPKPKSEAWLLCAASTASQSCAALEAISGNDDSPNSAKDKLDAALGGHKSGDELCD